MAAVDRSSPMPLWAQVLDDLTARLEADEFRDGFPTDAELTARYGVSRHTAREAVRRLQEQGLVSRERGRGTFVAAPTIEQPTGAIYSLSRSIEAQGVAQRSEVLDLACVTDAAVARQLGRRANTSLVRLERIRFAGDDVLAHDTSWLPASLAKPLLGVDFTTAALYDELAQRCGVVPSAGQEWITTEVPAPGERELLGIQAGVAVFRICRLARADDRPIEWRVTVVRGDRYRFIADWSPRDGYQAVLTASEQPG